jgi:hypothetical protein
MPTVDTNTRREMRLEIVDVGPRTTVVPSG